MLLDLLPVLAPGQQGHDTTASRYTPAPLRARGFSRHRIRLHVTPGPVRVVGRSPLVAAVTVTPVPTVRATSTVEVRARAQVLHPRTEADDDLSLLLLLGATR